MAIKEISDKSWLSYKSLLTADFDDLPLPANLEYFGTLDLIVDYIPNEKLLSCLRDWLRNNREKSIYYYLTECVGAKHTYYEIDTEDLTVENLQKINPLENLFVGKQFDWAIYIHHEGQLHIAGEESLYQCLKKVDNGN